MCWKDPVVHFWIQTAGTEDANEVSLAATGKMNQVLTTSVRYGPAKRGRTDRLVVQEVCV